MSRIRFRDFRSGWVPMGPRDGVPATAMRRARGIRPPMVPSIRSRFGSQFLWGGLAHSLTKFGPDRFAGVGPELWRNGVSIYHLLSGARLTFVSMPPAVGDPDFLFVAGGGVLLKVDESGAVSNWGIAPPSTGFTAAAGAKLTRVIDTFDSAATWTGASCTLADEATIKQSGTNSMKMTVAAGATGIATKAITIDLSTYASGAVSPDADFLALYVLVDKPNNLDSIQLAFDINGTAFASDTYTLTTYPSTDVGGGSEFVTQVNGLASIVTESGLANDLLTKGADDPTSTSYLTLLGQVALPGSTSTWVRLRVPKAAFQRSGSAAKTWADVGAVRLTVIAKALGAVTVYFDDMELTGGAGLQGRYRYLVTYYNSLTDVRSNPAINADGTLPYVEVSNVDRQPVNLAALPTSTDPQVDRLELWRTVGNGVLYFKIDDIANGTTTYTDTIPDFAAMDSTATKLMQNLELPLDNTLPDSTLTFAWGPYDGAMWWCGNTATGTRGRVYYSPAGRPEGAGNFIELTDDDDPTQCGLEWNSTNYVFTQDALYAITGTGGVYATQQIEGCPGTRHPYTVNGTPYGIVYQAEDALRIFDGSTSKVVAQHSVADLFDGIAMPPDTLEPDVPSVLPFVGLVATASQDAYFVSDAQETLCITLPDGVWRYLGVASNALFYEDDAGHVLASILTGVTP